MDNEQRESQKSNTYLSRTDDYLGNLGAKLRDLRGIITLAHELIQNADDAPDAKSMVLDIRHDALVVDNDGVFRDCQHLENVECSWKTDQSIGHRCDFHRFRCIGAGDKRGEAETTGAFGIGFISVYQVTDSPEIISAHHHWIIHEEKPEEERIEVCHGCSTCQDPNLPGTRFILPGTRFILPWALDAQSELRVALRADPVFRKNFDPWREKLVNSLPTAMLFLKKLSKITIKHNGHDCKSFERRLDEAKEEIIISSDNYGGEQRFKLIYSDFNEKAGILRAEHVGRIEKKRLSRVSIAIPAEEVQDGLLFACLPTEHETGLPFHINADFFPSNDRRSVILQDDYQSKWNEEAILSAAQSLAENIDKLKEFLGHERLWKLLIKLKTIEGKIFCEFWSRIEPYLKTGKIVFTSTAKWVDSNEAVLLLNKEEAPIIPILEKMGLNIVHEDLRPYHNLLRYESVGVQLLDINKVCDALKSFEMSRRQEPDSWPSFLSETCSHVALWHEILELYKRKENKDQICQLKNIAIAPGRDGALWPCKDLFRADEPTVILFQQLSDNIAFVEDTPEFADIASILCPSFTVDSAIDCLARANGDVMSQLWQSGPSYIEQLFCWFERYKSNILNTPETKEAFVSLPIFPSSDGLHKLSDLSVPGDFEDPLGLAKIVDLRILSKHSEFLKRLGMNELDFQTYAKCQLPAALKGRDVSPDKRDKAVKLLASRIGEIKDNPEVRKKLSEVPLAKCTNGEFYPPSVCYFDTSDVRQCLDKDALLVRPQPDDYIKDLFKWLGVAEYPRYKDVISHVQKISNSGYSVKLSHTVENIVAHLGKMLADGVELKDGLEPLKSLLWLPAKGKNDRWYSPHEIYANYQDYLFETQALFLKIPTKIERDSSDFLKFLGVNTKPTLKLVVEHLLYCASKGLPVNSEVYVFLNNDANNPFLERLKCKKCLYYRDEYFEPLKVFWGEHRFGHYRQRLGDSLRSVSKLLGQIGVRESPDYKDAFEVLKEISKEFGSKNKIIDTETKEILFECWRMLEKELTNNSPIVADVKDMLASLKNVRCIPNRQLLLFPPEWIFFENRVGLVEKFGNFLADNVINRPIDVGTAMVVAGVKSLGTAVKVQLLNTDNPTEAVEVREKVVNRRDQIGRALGNERAQSTILDCLETITCQEVTSLNILYKLSAFNQEHKSIPETVPALYLSDEKRLLFMRRNGEVPWSAFARELAVALFKDEDPGQIAAPLKDVLAAETIEEADAVLDDLGFARIDTSVARPSNSTDTVDILGDETLLGIPPSLPLNQPSIPEEQSLPLNETANGATESTKEPSAVDFHQALSEALNKPGKITLDDRPETGSSVKNPERRRGKEEGHLRELVDSEPDPSKRRTQITRTILEGTDEQVRNTLEEWYGGKCQICGDTFVQRDGHPFFIANYVVKRKVARQADTYANALCLCANHFAQWEHGALKADNIIDQVQSMNLKAEGGAGPCSISIKLCGEEQTITFNENHVIALQALLNVTEEVSSVKVDTVKC